MASKSKSKSKPKQQRVKPAYEGADIEGILDCIAEGASIREACGNFKVKASSLMRWVFDDIDGLAEQYARAQEIGAYLRADETGEIADDSRNDFMTRQNRSGGTYQELNRENIRRSEIRIAQRQWHLNQVRTGGYRRNKIGGNELGDIAGALASLATLAAAKQASAG